MRDLVISGGTTFDGTEAPAADSDAATPGERTVAVDVKGGPAYRAIQVGGCLMRAER